MSGCSGSIFLDNSNGAVLGANFMRGRDVVFDVSDERRIHTHTHLDTHTPRHTHT
jgi:hypothetical protein